MTPPEDPKDDTPAAKTPNTPPGQAAGDASQQTAPSSAPEVAKPKPAAAAKTPKQPSAKPPTSAKPAATSKAKAPAETPPSSKPYAEMSGLNAAIAEQRAAETSPPKSTPAAAPKTAAAPKASTPPPTTAKATAAQADRAGWSGASVALTGLVALVVGGVGAIWAGPQLAPYTPRPIADFLTGTGSETAEAVAALENRLTALETAGDDAAAAATAALQTRLEALAAEVAALSDGAAAANESDTPSSAMAAELAERVAALETAEPEITGAEIEAALARIEALETAEPEITGAEIAALESRLSATEETLAAATARAEQAEALLEEARTEAQTLARRADMTSEMERITAAIDSGAAFDDALVALSEMVDSPPPEALSAAAGGDLASMASLVTGFVPASQAALRADIAANASDSTLGQATAWLQSQVVSRPTEAQEGDGVAAILSRVDDALDAGDAPTALAEAEALPDAPKAALGGWLDQLRARAEVEAALSRWLAGIGTEQKG